MYFTGDDVIETPAPRKFYQKSFCYFIQPTPSLNILLGTKRCDKIDFQLEVLYNFSCFEIRISVDFSHIESKIGCKYNRN